MKPIRAIFVMLLCFVSLPALLAAKAASVSISGGQFSPASVDVQVGDTVTWTNNDDRDHTVVGSGFKSGNLRPGASYSFQFTKAGRFSYGSSIYPRMKGTINVKDKDKLALLTRSPRLQPWGPDAPNPSPKGLGVASN